MVVVPAGTIAIGSVPGDPAAAGTPADVAIMEHPRHQVRIARPFAVSRTEITRGAYAAFVAATGRPDGETCYAWSVAAGAWQNQGDLTWRAPGFPQRDDEPVVCVSWDDAAAYAAWLSALTRRPYRLLSEAEWEYAARAGKPAARYGDGALCAIANVSDRTRAGQHGLSQSESVTAPCDDGFVATSPVATFVANAFGLHDMLGNVWEWTADCAHDSYEGAPQDGSVWVDGGDCKQRSNRGGAWADPPWRVRSALREWDPPAGRYVINGIRVARDITE
jgi:formylglycine-generating enzyme required for sulfatase activity